MFQPIAVTTIQFASYGEDVLGSQILGLFAQQDRGDIGIQSQIVAIYDELRPILYRNLVFLGFDPGESDDTIQDAFLDLVRQLNAKREIRDMRSWLFRAVHSHAITTTRKQLKIRLRGEEAEAHARQLPEPSLNPEEAFLNQEQLRRYEVAVERLTSQQRQCLLLRKEGLRYREIAVAIGVSPSRVPQLLERAVSRLMEEIYA